MTRIVLASANLGKVAEFERLFDGSRFEVVAQSSLGVPSVDEPYATFLDNALVKARHAARLSRRPALADDSGLSVDALAGAPGVHSARFAGSPTDDAKNNDELLRRLVGEAKRSAHYTCVLVAVRCEDDSAPLVAEAQWHGTILTAPRGSGGFGYDPLFLPDGLALSAAELSPDLKNRLSHRARALQQIKRKLQDWLDVD